ncbi:alpha/beta hydrolase [Candidatus Margulisiibacteriota bacterium]
MRGIAKYLQRYGITSYCPKLKGHGTSFYDVEKLRMKDWLAQIKEIANKDDYDYVIGLCAGANLALDLAVEKDYEKIVLLSPLFKYRPQFLGINWPWILPIIRPFYPYYPKKPIHYEDLIAYNILPIINIYDLYRYNKKTLRKLSKVDEHTLVLFGEQDDLYAADLPNFLSAKLKNSEVHIITNGKHVLSMIEAKDKVFKIIKDFLLEKPGA